MDHKDGQYSLVSVLEVVSEVQEVLSLVIVVASRMMVSRMQRYDSGLLMLRLPCRRRLQP